MNVIRLKISTFGLAAVAASALPACSSSSATAAPGGGTGAAGGTTGVTVTPSDISITGTVTQCPGTTPGTLPDVTATSCTFPSCQNATCVPQDQIAQFSPDQDLSLLGTCSPGVYCVPNDFIATTGDFLVQSCNSLQGAEGRCISKCIPQVAAQLTTLPQDTCGADELCAPCVNPIDGTDTGACSQSCDPGPDPSRPPVVFPECGGGAGVCVPSTLVTDPVQLASLQAVDDPTGICADSTQVCAPKLKAADQSAPFVPCTMTSAAAALATMANSTGQLSACVPSYIVPVAQQPLLLQDGCQANELCAPCFNPLSMPANEPTGACPP
jgi:hypothetical protein